MGAFDDIFNRIVAESMDKREQGTRFEHAVAWFLRNDPAWSERIKRVWLWDEAPTNAGEQDTGIDLVALDEDGTYWAIQAKCYSGTKLALTDVGTFFANALADKRYQHYMIADTASGYTSNLEDYINKYPDLDIVRLDSDTMRDANLDWDAFEHDRQPGERKLKKPWPHQREAIDAVKKELSHADRCSLVMACGTGKTITSLRFTEEFIGNGGDILFLAPSISLVSQSMRDWVNQVSDRIHVYVVCSDGKASKLRNAAESYGQLSDIPFPATTNPVTVTSRFKPRKDALNVVFSTYQSIQVIHDAQELGLPDFDLTICDEAHRTTGVIDGEAAFQKVHDADYIHSRKRLYMTATPRIFSQKAQNKAVEGAIEIASMDDVSVYGRVAYRLSFGKAVDQKLLTDYKIVVMQVAESMIPKAMQKRYSAKDSEIPLDDAAKFVGCWKALFDRRHAQDINDLAGVPGRHAATGADDAKRVLHHAIAFAPSIKASKALTNKFRAVIDDYTSNLEITKENQPLLEAGRTVTVDIDHVDGGMDAGTRKDKLEWLAEQTEPNECHILSNARCLAEGIDVPSLDAVIYLSSRKSKVDIIQSVGRVMRRAPGKQYGYIVIPVVIPMGGDADSVLSSGAYSTVWDVVTALRSHDERLDAIINSASLGDTDALSRIIEVDVLDESRLKKAKKRTPGENTPPIGGEGPDGEPGDGNEGAGEPGKRKAMQPDLDFDMSDIARGINAQIVRKCGTKIYWGEWTEDIAAITQARAARIAELVESGPAREPFMEFVQGLRDSLNPGYSETEAIAVLAQHEITKPIFETLFTNKDVLANNPIVQGLDRALDALYAAGLPDSIDSPTLRDLYGSVRLSAAQLTSDVAKQNLIKEIYNDFFAKAFKDTAESLGIVYTPVEVVDAQLHMVQRALKREFGQSLGDKDVHILDGFAGTGTYICRLIEDGSLISDEDLPYKYMHDLHSNEIVPLAATIMDINIEQSYHKRIGGEYEAFPGALLADTFQMHEHYDPLDTGVFAENTERVRKQQNLPIRIIVGNPPYSNEHKDLYPKLKKRVEETYAAESSATLKNNLYNSYYLAMRWATDRIGEAGIVCFVSGAGWLRGGAGDGVRKTFAKEFNDIYVYDLRGNKEFRRLTKEQLIDEGDNIFDSGSKSPIAISLLIKNPESSHHGVIHYVDCGARLSLEEKKDQLREVADTEPDWRELQADRHGDWLDHRDESYYEFIPIGVQEGQKKKPTGLFTIWSSGIKTQRDAWCYSFNRDALVNNMRKTIDFFNSEESRYKVSSQKLKPGQFVNHDDSSISWSDFLYKRIENGKRISFKTNTPRTVSYRPFCKQYGWFDPQINDRPGQQPSLFPTADSKNLEICMVGPNAGQEWSCLITDCVPDLHMQSTDQCFPLYYYEKVITKPEHADAGVQDQLFGDSQGQLGFEYESDADNTTTRYVRHDAITDTALKVFRKAYPNVRIRRHAPVDGRLFEDGNRGSRISKEDIFYYVYGILHSPEYRRRFGNNLRKELPRIPLAKDFKAFMDAGRELAALHLGYESVDRWPVMEVGDRENPGRTEKMTYPNKVTDPDTGKKVPDRTVLRVADGLTVHGIPLRAYEYVVNGKSAIDWLRDRYKVTTDKKSGIVNDPNGYSDDPRYIVDLVERVITVSMRTLDIVDSLPPLEELPQPAEWPADWHA
ncbi:type ISP restriction/modification enzyme [Bifidobacterium dentium]|uniref:type ISP restriction/modification enzyme n=1 Tax=Bifidobacterium dentium TaxID=1689 RepID=UPI0018A05F49|nr:type ISP restriction/modification enzyme [Bifidobacterium dentium]